MTSQRYTLEDGRYGRRAVLCSAWSEHIAYELVVERVAELELNYAKGWTGNDLSFLAKLPNLKAFKIVDWTIDSVEPVHGLHQLKSLEISTYCKTQIQFSAFPELENCALEWRAKARSIFDCVTLRKLFLNRYRRTGAEPFANLTNLEELAILNSPVKDLTGLGPLQELRKLRLGGLRVLTSLRGVDRLTSLQELVVEACRKIRSIEEVGSLPRLKKLSLNDGGKIKSLTPIGKLRELESVSFWGSTDIVDGDLSPLAEQTHLKSVSFQNRRHYSHSREKFKVA